MWFETMRPTGLPLFITEYGQYAVAEGEQRDPAKERARAEAIRTDAAWIAEHPRIRMWMYWQAVGAQGDWRMHDEASQRAWREVAETGCGSADGPGERGGAGADRRLAWGPAPPQSRGAAWPTTPQE